MKKAKLALERMGYEILSEAKRTGNGPDLHVRKDGLILRVEVKTARRSKRSSGVERGCLD